jgi:hypothetical protein
MRLRTLQALARAHFPLALCAQIGLAPSALGQSPAPAPQAFRDLTPEQALEAAGKEGKLALLAFLEPDAQPTKAYEGFTFPDPSVASWLAEEVVAARSIGDAEVARRFDVHARPALVFARPDGTEVDRIDSYLEPAPFLDAARTILEQQSPTALAQQAVASAPDDVRAHMDLARALLKRKRSRAALGELAWLFDRTRGDPAWEAERFGFVVERIGFLQRTAPEAKAWLEQRRERAHASLVAERSEPAPEAELALDARELVVLNEALREIHATVACWDELRARPAASSAALRVLFNRATQMILVDDKRYADLLAGAGDPLVVIQEGIARLRALDEAAGPTRTGVQPNEQERWALIEEASRYYLALLGVEREADAGALADLVLGVEPSVKAYQCLIASAQAAERNDLAQALVERGLASLPESERQRLHMYIQRMQKKGS